MVSFPRRQQARRLRRAASHAACAASALAAAVLVADAGAPRLALVLVVLAVLFALAGRRALRLAARSRVGAESEAHVRRALERLAREGWSVQHAVDWPGGGDLDHVVQAPSGIAFVIETKTLRWTRAHLSRTSGAARRLARRRRRYRRGFVPVLCVAHARGVEGIHGDVLIVSLDRLVPTLRAAAGGSPAAAAAAAASSR